MRRLKKADSEADFFLMDEGWTKQRFGWNRQKAFHEVSRFVGGGSDGPQAKTMFVAEALQVRQEFL